MPAASPTKLVDAVLRAIQKSGGTGFYMSERLATHPREFLIQYGEDTISLWVYMDADPWRPAISTERIQNSDDHGYLSIAPQSKRSYRFAGLLL